MKGREMHTKNEKVNSFYFASVTLSFGQQRTPFTKQLE